MTSEQMDTLHELRMALAVAPVDMKGLIQLNGALCGRRGVAIGAAISELEQAGRMREALTALVAKIEAIEADPSFNGLFTLGFAHGAKYTGPDWEAELKAARAALAPTGSEEVKP